MTAGTVAGFSPRHTAELLRAVAVAREDPGTGVRDLAERLYVAWYAAANGQAQSVDPTWPPIAGLLREGHRATDDWQSGTVLKIGAGGIVVVRDSAGIPRALIRGSYTHAAGSSATGLAPQSGETLRILPRSGSVPTEGWWRTWGGGWDPRSANGDVTRVYLTADIRRLPGLSRAVTTVLGDSGRPWMLKAGESAPTIARPDGFVIYLRDADADDLLEDLARQAAPFVRPANGPPLTADLAPGIAWARDPGDGRSFGESRCLLVAAALVGDAATAAPPAETLRSPVEAIAGAFVSAGLDPRFPHLRGPVVGGDEHE